MYYYYTEGMTNAELGAKVRINHERYLERVAMMTPQWQEEGAVHRKMRKSNKITMNGKIIVIEEGKFLAQELYKFNEKLNELEKCPILFVQDVREILSQAVSDINTKIKNLKEENQKLYSTNCDVITPPHSITKKIKRRDY